MKTNGLARSSKLLMLRLYYQMMSGALFVWLFLVSLIVSAGIYSQDEATAVKIMSVGLLILVNGILLRTVLFNEAQRRKTTIVLKK